MATKRCPGCGAPYNGKRCRICCYTTFDAPEASRIWDSLPHREIPSRRNRVPELREEHHWPASGIGRRLFWTLTAVILAITAVFGILLPLNRADMVATAFVTATPETIALPEDGLILYESPDVRLILGWNGGPITQNISVYLENNSDRDISASTNGVAVNGMMTDSVFFYLDARKGTTSMSQLWIEPELLERQGIDEIAQIELQPEVIEEYSYMLLNKPETITFGPGGSIPLPDAQGRTIVNNDVLFLVFQGVETDGYGNLYLRFFAKNKSGEILELTSTELLVNGQSTGQHLWQRFFPDTGAVILTELYEAQSLRIEAPEDLHSLELSVITVDEYWESQSQNGPVVLQLEK